MRNHRMVSLAPVAALLFAAFARAQVPVQEPLAETVQLEYVRWPGAEDCPDEDAMRHAIGTAMKADPFSPKAKAKLRVNIYRVGPNYQASYDIVDSKGHTLLWNEFPEREKCANSVGDVAFSVSIQLPILITGPVPKPRAEEQAPPPAPVCAPPPAAPAPVCSSPPVKTAPPSMKLPVLPPFRLDFGLGLIWGGVNDVAPGLSLHFGRRWPSFSLSGGFRFELGEQEGAESTRVTLQRGFVEAVPCLHFPLISSAQFLGSWADICGGVGVGALRAHIHALDLNKTGEWPLALVGAHFGAHFITTSGVGAFIRMGGDVTFANPHVVVSPVYNVKSITIAFTGTAGFIVMFSGP